MKQSEKNNLKNWASKFFSESGKDFKAFDIEAETDGSITLEENKTILRKKIKEFINIYETPENLIKEEAEIIGKDEHESLINKKLAEFELIADQEFIEVLKKIEQDKTTSLIEDIFFIPKEYTKMVIKGNSRGFLLYGEAGLGKTYSVLRAFQEQKAKFKMLSGHITSLELYHFLFDNRKEHIILDDVNLLENEQNLNMLKCCLSDNSRIVQYHTTSSKLRVPNKFLFEGSIIIILNKIPQKNENLEAVKSRILNYELKLSYKEKIKVIFELARLEYKNLSEKERFIIANWLKSKTSEATENLNLRLLFTLFEMYRYDKEMWKKLGEEIIKTDDNLLLIVQGLDECEFQERTGLSRATYYRCKQKVTTNK